MYTYDFQATCLFFKQTDGCTYEERCTCTVIKQFRPILFVQEYTCMYILLLMLIVHNG